MTPTQQAMWSTGPAAAIADDSLPGMKVQRRSTRRNPKVSLILLDWSVRESFHVLDYLRRQTAPRDSFEVIIVEYYSTVSTAVERFADQVDTWALLSLPPSTYYHKHLMYNAGLLLARGDIVVIKDSDAMVRESFIAHIQQAFAADPNIVFHIDQFRNNRRDLYPFNFPDFSTVLGDGCINNIGGRTSGLAETVDPLHVRNYGACMCARREDLIAIGGADEHIDFLGHVCGPYDMTFRLVNLGRREVWSPDEFSYHTWHPGQAGEGNYLGPHDGRHLSTTSLQALLSGRVMPLVENVAIRALRQNPVTEPRALEDRLIRPEAARAWDRTRLAGTPVAVCPVDRRTWVGSFRGARLIQEGTSFSVENMPFPAPSLERRCFASAKEACAAIEEALPAGWLRRIALVERLAQRIGLARRALRRLRHAPPTPTDLWRRLTCRAQPSGGEAANGQWTPELDIGNLVVALLAVAANPARPLPEVAVVDAAAASALRLAMLTRQLPRTRVYVVADTAAAERLLAVVTPERPVLLQGLAYMRHYPVLRRAFGRGLQVD